MRTFKMTFLILAMLARPAPPKRAGFPMNAASHAKPMSEIIKSVEDKGYKIITELEFDDGVWKIEVHQPDGKEVRIKVDPVAARSADRLSPWRSASPRLVASA